MTSIPRLPNNPMNYHDSEILLASGCTQSSGMEMRMRRAGNLNGCVQVQTLPLWFELTFEHTCSHWRSIIRSALNITNNCNLVCYLD